MSAAENISGRVRRLRKLKGWTQAEAVGQFNRVSGENWSEASWGLAERVGKGRQRAWTANEIYALAQLFEVPVGDLFETFCGRCEGTPPLGFTCNVCGSVG